MLLKHVRDEFLVTLRHKKETEVTHVTIVKEKNDLKAANTAIVMRNIPADWEVIEVTK